MFHITPRHHTLPGAVIPGLVLIGMILVGCGAPTSTANSAGPVRSIPLQSGKPPSASLTQHDTGEQTINHLDLSASISCPDWIVLTPHAAVYTSAELAAIKEAMISVNPYDVTPPVSLPPTLAVVAGGGECSGYFDVTNTGSSLIQLNKVGFQNTQAAARFSYSYRLIDVCPYLPACDGPGLGGNPPCSYGSSAGLSLTQTQTLSAIDAIPEEDNGSTADCPVPINLRSGQSIQIAMQFFGSGETWFHGAPALNVTTAQGTTTLIFNMMVFNFIFAPLDGGFPGTCYTQKGNRFVPATFKQIPDASKDPPYDYPICV